MSLDTDIKDTNKNTNKKKYIGILLLVLFWCGVYTWWNYEFPSATWRYKLTVTVETPEGLKTGSAVREVYAYASIGFMGVEATVHHHLRHGEAVVVDMGHNKYLFAIMDVDGSYRIVRDTFPYNQKSHGDYVRHYKSLKAGPVVVSSPNLPTLVTFKDMKDPKTVVAVDRANLETEFGTGVKIRDVIIEMTDEPVTRRIRPYLPSFDADGYRKWVGTLTYGDPRKVDNRNFLIGE